MRRMLVLEATKHGGLREAAKAAVVAVRQQAGGYKLEARGQQAP